LGKEFLGAGFSVERDGELAGEIVALVGS